MSNSSLGGLFYTPELSPVFDGIFRLKMPGTRPGIPFLSALAEVDR
jgi:hypothetical protein